MFASLGNLLNGYAGLVGLRLQTLQSLFRFDNLPLERVILLLGNLAVGKSRVRLLGGGFEGRQLLLRFGNSLAQKFVLLGEKFRISGVQL